MFTIGDDEIRTSDLLVADGEQREIRADGCEGWEAVWFSEDGRRAFTRSSYSCDGVTQSGTGVLALVSPTQWVDVRALEVDGERTSWVQRYRLIGRDRADRQGVSDTGFGMGTAARAARFVAHRGVGLPEVEEAVREVDAEAVQGWLANRDEGFRLTGADLEALADAGVPESVIDVVVAKSFPERFRVASDGDAARAAAIPRVPSDGLARPRRLRYSGIRAPFAFRVLGYGYGYVPADAFFRYGYGYTGYGPSGYGYPYYPGYWGYQPGTVIIERREPEPQGRIERGRGYTRSSGGGGDAAVPRSGSSGGSSPAAAPSGGSDGESQSGSTEPKRRTARPRGPGG
jgi:hypothetical protein